MPRGKRKVIEAEQPGTSPEAQAEQPDTSPEAQAEQEPDEKDFVIKVKRGQALVQAAITDLHHPFEGVWITTANPVVVKRDSWLESQIAAKLIKVLK